MRELVKPVAVSQKRSTEMMHKNVEPMLGNSKVTRFLKREATLVAQVNEAIEKGLMGNKVGRGGANSGFESPFGELSVKKSDRVLENDRKVG